MNQMPFCRLKSAAALMLFILSVIFYSGIAYSATPKVFAGAGHTVLLSQQGAIWSWGSNKFGQLGDGTKIDRSVPVKLPFFGIVKDIACGERHTVALMKDGKIFAWGGNNHGQLGNGKKSNSNNPVRVLGLANVTAIASGWWHTVALKNDGSVWTWGKNSEGQLGNGTTTGSNNPVQVLGLSDVVAIAAGWGHSIALKSDGTVWTWGNNRSGQLGNGLRNPELRPVQVRGSSPDSYLSEIAAIACGGWHSLAIASDGSLWAWGGNMNGQLGDADLRSRGRELPVQVKGIGGIGYLSGVLAVSGGWMHTLALTKSEVINVLGAKNPSKNDGIALAWGGNDSGQVGNGRYDKTSLPVQVQVQKGSPPTLQGVVSIAAGFYYSVAVDNQGAIWAWGDNSCGQIGDGTNVTRPKAKKLAFRIR